MGVRFMYLGLGCGGRARHARGPGVSTLLSHAGGGGVSKQQKLSISRNAAWLSNRTQDVRKSQRV